ncbi:MAG: hypothetical protein RLZZ598_588 [Pseudomonadota bacterium]|jgi:2-polyprenyl-6-methoxyphenol hydroxylase-like FAD-dependent oxidoreductase
MPVMQQATPSAFATFDHSSSGSAATSTWSVPTRGPEATDTDVLIVGAGATGLTLACDLARRGVRFRILDKAQQAFGGSRGKGIQPRTLEVFDGLGIAKPLLAAGAPYPPMRLHWWFLRWTWHMIKPHKQTPDVPYPNTWLVPQWRTEEVLRSRLAELGCGVEYGSEVTDFAQDAAGVVVQLSQAGVSHALRARYLVGADGGRSFVRKRLGVKFIGNTSDEGRMIVGDLRVDGLSREHWHVWPTRKGGMVALCPLPHSDLFQLMMKIDPSEVEPELSESSIQSRWLAATGLKNLRLHSPAWLSVFRPNVRLVERYRTAHVLLAGDAAHVHTPAGAQGLNTGVQDAWNLGWKLALVLRGAPEALLDTYEEERMPVAAGVLKLSSELFKATTQRTAITRLTRGDEERQLLLNYHASSLADAAGAGQVGKVLAGDRAPDAPCAQSSAARTTLFDAFRGGHFTVLAFGTKAIAEVQPLNQADPSVLRVVAVVAHSSVDGQVVDDQGHARRAYGVGDDENVTFVVRPDGYVGQVASGQWRQAITNYLNRVLGPALQGGAVSSTAALA